jgi:8-oxo-dGTP pyrophosphatase MutT (NUDIX family)
MNYIELIKNYKPVNEQEATDQKLMLDFFSAHDDALERTNLIGHVTSSVFILNQEKTKVLLGYHNIYQSWGWFGGHNDGDEDCYNVAIKEAKEETGIDHFLLSQEDPVALDVIFVQNHIKYGHYVSDHLHLNVTYGLIVDEKTYISYNNREHSGLKWVSLENYLDDIKEPRMVDIYQKIVRKMTQ